jgi:hypothetical protein
MNNIANVNALKIVIVTFVYIFMMVGIVLIAGYVGP